MKTTLALTLLSCLFALSTAVSLRVEVKLGLSRDDPRIAVNLRTDRWERGIDMVPVKHLDGEEQSLIFGYYDRTRWGESCALYFGNSAEFKHAIVGVCGEGKWRYKGVLAPVEGEKILVLKKAGDHHVVEEVERLSSCSVLHEEKFHAFSRSYRPSQVNENIVLVIMFFFFFII